MGEFGDLLAAQPGDASPRPAVGQRRLLHAHLGALGPQEGGEFVAPVDFHGPSLIARVPADLSEILYAASEVRHEFSYVCNGYKSHSFFIFRLAEHMA